MKFQINIKNFNQPKILLESLIIKLCYLDKTININKYLFEKKNLNNAKDNPKVDESNKINSEEKNIIDVEEKKTKIDKNKINKEKNNNEELKIVKDVKKTKIQDNSNAIKANTFLRLLIVLLKLILVFFRFITTFPLLSFSIESI